MNSLPPESRVPSPGPRASVSSPKSGLPGTIAFLGGGNMACALIGGLLRNGAPIASLRVSEPRAEARAALAHEFGVATYADNVAAASGAGLWVLAVKPQVLRAVCEALTPLAQRQRPLLLSIAAGIRGDQIERWLGGDLAVVRAMPNTPALLGAGATALHANARVDGTGRAQATAVMQATGVTCWIDDEVQMDVVTALSGSGPAYFFLLAEALQAAAAELGLPPATARLLAAQTCLGAGRMLREDGADAAALRQRVTSPGGTTAAALDAFDRGGFGALVTRAVRAAAQRAAELSVQAEAAP